MSARRIAVGAAAALVAGTVLSGCSAGGPMADPTGRASSRPPFLTSSATVPPTDGTDVAVPAARWDAIVADLAGRGVQETPTLVTSRSVQWQNGALGCPKPGSSYTQQIIDGAQIVVRADGREWDYRFGRGDAPVLCRA